MRAAINAVNRQITENFVPIWGCGRDLVSFAPTFDPADPDTLAEEDVPADSVMYLVSRSKHQGCSFRFRLRAESARLDYHTLT